MDFYVTANANRHKKAIVVLLTDQMLPPSYHWFTPSWQFIADESRTRRLFDLPSVQVEHAELAVIKEDQCEEIGEDDLKVRELQVFLEEDHVHHVLEGMVPQLAVEGEVSG